MKQAEKSSLSREKILNAAIAEFGSKSYENSSLNNICNDNGISKGLIYHYFKNKDDLYLSSLKSCFDEITQYLSNGKYGSGDFKKDINELLNLRYKFLKENSNYSNIFFNAVLQPPKHLKDEIKKIRKNFDDFISVKYRQALKSITLRNEISEKEAMEYFFIFQEMFNGYFESKAYENSDFTSLVYDHEIKLSKILNFMLYGIAKENNSK